MSRTPTATPFPDELRVVGVAADVPLGRRKETADHRAGDVLPFARDGDELLHALGFLLLALREQVVDLDRSLRHVRIVSPDGEIIGRVMTSLNQLERLYLPGPSEGGREEIGP